MYQFRDKKKYKNRINLIKTIILGIVILLLFVLGIVSWSGGFLNKVGIPFWKGKNAVVSEISNSGYITRTKASVFAENETLKSKLMEQSGAMTDYQLLKSENVELKKLFDRVPANITFTLGNVLTRPSSSPYDTLIIDIGKDVGLQGGEQVFANSEVPIGTVSEVYSSTSLITLYSSPDQKTEAMISGSNATVELTGRGGGNFEMTIPIELSAENGTSVFLPNLESRIIAVVQSNLSNQTDAVKKVLLRSPVNIFQLKWVEVKRN